MTVGRFRATGSKEERQREGEIERKRVSMLERETRERGVSSHAYFGRTPTPRAREPLGL